MNSSTITIPKSIVTDTTLTASGLRLYCLLREAKSRTRKAEFEVPISELRAALKVCAWSISRRIAELEERGYIQVRRPRCGQVNKYRLLQ